MARSKKPAKKRLTTEELAKRLHGVTHASKRMPWKLTYECIKQVFIREAKLVQRLARAGKI